MVGTVVPIHRDNGAMLIRPRPWLGILVQCSVVATCALFGVVLFAGAAPAWRHLAASGNWVGMCYLALLCGLLVLHWPHAIFNLAVTILSQICPPPAIHDITTPDAAELPPLEIVVATRNEPADVVIPLLASLISSNYPRLKIILADNSDLRFADGSANADATRIFDFVSVHADHIELVRRSLSARAPGSPLSPADYGDCRGGKAGNLNAALQGLPPTIRWVIILDSDSAISPSSLRQFSGMLLLADRSGENVGFIQGVLLSDNAPTTSVSSAIGTVDDHYYRNVAWLKSCIGVASNWGHGVIVSRSAWQATGGFPEEVSEDLAWANELAISGRYSGCFAPVPTFEGKPTSWDALRIQRFKWAKGTTDLIPKQLARVWRSRRIRLHEKLCISYDMMHYINVAIGCFFPLLFLPIAAMGRWGAPFFVSLIPAFAIVLVAENAMLPIQTVRLLMQRDFRRAGDLMRCMPLASLYHGAVASAVLAGVVVSIARCRNSVSVTPKRPTQFLGLLATAGNNKICLTLGIVNGMVALHLVSTSLCMAICLLVSPLCYLTVPFLDRVLARDAHQCRECAATVDDAAMALAGDS